MSQAEMTNTTSRRGFLTRGAATVAGGAAIISTSPARSALASWRKSISPEVAAAIERCRAATTAADEAYEAYSEAEWAAKDSFGNPPFGLIHWRNYHIGEGELEQTRDFLLADGLDKDQIEQEYIDAQARFRASHEREIAWQQRAGIAHLAKQRSDTEDARWAAIEEIVKIEPSSMADGIALQDMIFSEIIKMELDGPSGWEMTVLKTVHSYFQSIA